MPSEQNENRLCTIMNIFHQHVTSNKKNTSCYFSQSGTIALKGGISCNLLVEMVLETSENNCKLSTSGRRKNNERQTGRQRALINNCQKLTLAKKETNIIP